MDREILMHSLANYGYTKRPAPAPAIRAVLPATGDIERHPPG